jgi:leucine dehydrogenase
LEERPLFDALRDAGLERLRFSRHRGPARALVAESDGPWLPADERLAPEGERLRDVLHLMTLSGHERLDLVLRAEVGLRFLCAVHSTARGPGAGGLRRHDPVTPESEVLEDLLGLSRAMSYKHVFCGNRRGGSKLAVHNTEFPEYDHDRWVALLAEEIGLSGTITGPDVGFRPAVLRDLARHTPAVTGVQGGGTGGAAAQGVLAALGATAAALGSPLGQLRVAVQGLGGLGMPLAESLAGAGCELVVTDRDPDRLDRLLAALDPQARRRVNVVAPYQILDVEADVLSPNALGGLIDDEALARDLGFRAVCGGANCQLASRTLTEDLKLAERLHAKGVLFVPDWMASCGGAIAGVMEHEARERFDLRAVEARIQRVCGWQVDEVLVQARSSGRSPLAVATEHYLMPFLSAEGRG